MGRNLIIGDIHSRYEKLTAVLEKHRTTLIQTFSIPSVISVIAEKMPLRH